MTIKKIVTRCRLPGCRAQCRLPGCRAQCRLPGCQAQSGCPPGSLKGLPLLDRTRETEIPETSTEVLGWLHRTRPKREIPEAGPGPVPDPRLPGPSAGSPATQARCRISGYPGRMPVPDAGCRAGRSTKKIPEKFLKSPGKIPKKSGKSPGKVRGKSGKSPGKVRGKSGESPGKVRGKSGEAP